MTQESHEISIVIPAKNEEKYINDVLDALFSAINNYAGNCEVIVVDNGSTDKTSFIASNFGCRVISAPLATSIGSMRNLGVKSSCGDIIAFLDADCLVDSNWINYCVERLADQKIGLVGTRAVPDLNYATWVEEGWYGLVSGVKRPDYPRWIGSSNMFIRKIVFDEIGGFNERLGTAEDVEICNMVSQNSYQVCLEKKITTIHLRESKTILQMIKREIWRGRSSIRQLVISKDKISDFKSVAIPMMTISFMVLTIIGIIMRNNLKWLLVALLLLPIGMIVNKGARIRCLRAFLYVYIVSLIYLISRAIAVFAELFDIARSFRNNKLRREL